jgi:hypothetical protein
MSNPRVNRYLKDKAFDHMDHALGRYHDPTGETHRNYFAIDAGSDLALQFDTSPWWAKSGQQADMAYYHVTDIGKQALKAHLAEHAPMKAFNVAFGGYSDTIPAPSASKAKYKYWLRVSDTDCDLTFIDFSRTARVRRAA